MFLLIAGFLIGSKQARIISIHLMFLLIYLSLMPEHIHNYFNTSHVSINQIRRSFYKNGRFISIHLMFLLICNPNYHHIFPNDFNTSHVSINRGCRRAYWQFTPISIHLMFLLIQRFYQLFRFYYISNSLKIPAFSNFSQV